MNTCADSGEIIQAGLLPQSGNTGLPYCRYFLVLSSPINITVFVTADPEIVVSARTNRQLHPTAAANTPEEAQPVVQISSQGKCKNAPSYIKKNVVGKINWSDVSIRTGLSLKVSTICAVRIT